MEGALCPQLSPLGGGSASDRGGSVSPAQPRWRGPCVHSSPPMERALCPQPTLGTSRPHPPPLPLSALSRPFLLAASCQKKPPLTLPGTVFSRLFCLNLKSACSVFRPIWLRKSAWEMSRYEKETSIGLCKIRVFVPMIRLKVLLELYRGASRGSALNPEPHGPASASAWEGSPMNCDFTRRSLQQRRPLRLGFRSLEYSLSQLT